VSEHRGKFVTSRPDDGLDGRPTRIKDDDPAPSTSEPTSTALRF